MWLEAVVPQQDWTVLLRELLPAAIRLGEDGELLVSEPTGVSLVADVGLRVVCKGTLRWTILGIHVPVTIESLAVVVRPEIVATREGQRLVFKLQIDHADVAGLPTVLDDRVTDRVNRELEAKHVELSWDYAGTLSHVFDIPPSLQPLEQLALTVVDARVKATGDALGLALRFQATVHRREAGADVPSPEEMPRPGRPSRPSSFGSQALSRTPRAWTHPAWVGAATLLALWGAYALGRSR
jgi:hypothetical protein